MGGAGSLEVVTVRPVGRDDLPLGFGGQAQAGPVCEGIGLVVTDVTHGLVRVDRARSGQSELPPLLRIVGVLEPVQRRLPMLVDHGGPAVREPELRTVVAIVLHEGKPLPAGDGPVGQGEGCQVDRVPGKLVVETETPALMPDLGHAAIVFDPVGLWWPLFPRCPDRGVGLVGGP